MSLATFGLRGNPNNQLAGFGLGRGVTIVQPPISPGGRGIRRRVAAGSSIPSQRVQTPAEYWAKIQKVLDQSRLEDAISTIYNYQGNAELGLIGNNVTSNIAVLRSKKPSFVTPLTYDGNIIVLYSPVTGAPITPITENAVTEGVILGNYEGNAIIEFYSPHLAQLQQEDILLVGEARHYLADADEIELESQIILDLL
jgi:hypothetical protein